MKVLLTEIFKLNEKLENVSNDKSFFWVAGEGGDDFKPGDVVPKFQGVPGAEKYEQAFEKVRKEKFTDRPSRLNSTFIFPNVHDAVQWRGSGKSKKIYQVVVTGKVFYTDLEAWTEAARNDLPEDKRQSWINQYWKGVNKVDKSPKRDGNTEAIVDGTVKIVKEIDPNKLDTLYDKRNDMRY